MIGKYKFSSKTFEKIFIGITGPVFIISSVLLLDDRLLFSKKRTGDELVTVGEVLVAKNDVRRKAPGQAVWEKIYGPTPVYLNDRIFTGEGSSVTILMNDTSRLTLSSDSLIVLGKNELNVEQGDLESELGERSKMALVVKGKRQELQGKGKSRLRVKVNEKGESDLLVLNGQVKLGATALSANEGIGLGRGKKKVKAYKVKLKSPALGEILGGGQSTVFRWAARRRKSDRYILEVSEDEGLEKIVHKLIYNKSKVSVPSLPFKKELYWRVKLVSNKAVVMGESPVYKFFIHQNNAPRPLIPIDGQLFLGKRPVEFKWVSDVDEQSFELQVAKGPKFKNIVYSVRTEGPKATWKEALKGDYFWRVRTLSNKRPSSAWGPGVLFSLDALPEAPISVSPRQAARVETPYTRKAITFEWKAADWSELENYQFEVLDFSTEREVIKKFIPPAKRGLVELELPHGQYKWRVISSKRKGLLKAKGDWRILTLDEIPTPGAPEGVSAKSLHSKGRNEFSLAWEEEDMAHFMILEIDRKDGKGIFKKRISIDEGQYRFRSDPLSTIRWRARLVDEWGREGESTSWKEDTAGEAVKGKIGGGHMAPPKDLNEFYAQKLRSPASIGAQKKVSDSVRSRPAKSLKRPSALPQLEGDWPGAHKNKEDSWAYPGL